MINFSTLSSTSLTDPSRLQHMFLQYCQDAWGGEQVMVDPNNTFSLQSEMVLSISATLFEEQQKLMRRFYKKRASTLDDLYPHMSDFDYLYLTSRPASTTVRLTFDRDYLINNAVVLDDNYRLVVIPANTVFKIGQMQYGIYYPIHIRINRRTNHVRVTWDTTSVNPLHTLTTNVVESVTYSDFGLNLLTLTFPVSQFVRSVNFHTFVAEQGFATSYTLSGLFYAIRAYAINPDGSRIEFDYTLSEDVYDRTRPTLKLKIIDTVTGPKLSVAIPRIYFSSALLTTQTFVTEVYTTSGAIDVSLSVQEQASCNFDAQLTASDVSDYSLILSNLSTVTLTPKDTKITGGSTGLSFTELRDQIVLGSLYQPVPVSPNALELYVQSNGFQLSQVIDNITDRVYYASKRMVTNIGSPVPVTTARLQARLSRLSDVKSILVHSDDVVTFLPTTLYRYVDTSNTAVPLTDAEVSLLGQLTGSQLADTLNASTTLRSPFHVVLHSTVQPEARTYDLMDLDDPVVQFVRENPYAPAQMSVVSAAISHLAHGTGGYQLRLGVTKTDTLAQLAEDQLQLILSLRDKSGRMIYLKVEKYGSTSTIDLYSAVLLTDYHIAQDHHIRVVGTVTSAAGDVVTSEIPLDASWTVRAYVRMSQFPDALNEPLLFLDAPDDITQATYLGLSEQSLQFAFGVDLSEGIRTNVDAVWVDEKYAKYEEDVPFVYQSDVPERDANGVPAYDIVDGTVKLRIAHRRGDIVRDPLGEPVIQYHKGSIKLDSNDTPIALTPRELVYYVDTIAIDARMYASVDASDVVYVSSLTTEVTGYCDTVAIMTGQTIDRTRLYFRPLRTLGSGLFGLGNGVKRYLPLAMAFTVRYYVPDSVYRDTALKTSMTETTADTIDAHMRLPVISMTEMSRSLRDAFGSNLVAIDVLGINGEPTLQTLTPLDNMTAPVVARRLVVASDGSLRLMRDVTVEFRLAS